MTKRRFNPTKSQRLQRKIAKRNQPPSVRNNSGSAIADSLRDLQGLDPSSRAIALLTVNAIDKLVELSKTNAVVPATENKEAEAVAWTSGQPNPDLSLGTYQDPNAQQPIKETTPTFPGSWPSTPNLPGAATHLEEDTVDYGYSDEEFDREPPPSLSPVSEEPRLSLFDRIPPRDLFSRINLPNTNRGGTSGR